MPMWFTVEEERPDIGTVIFKADDYYERLQHITGMWNDTKFLYYEIFRPSTQYGHFGAIIRDLERANKLFSIHDVTDVPTLLTFMERANLGGVLPEKMISFMYDLHKLYVSKMTEFGYATHHMSRKDYDLHDNHDKWTRLTTAIDDIRRQNDIELMEVQKKKRKLISSTLRTYTRIENLPNMYQAVHGTRRKSRSKSINSELSGHIQLDKNTEMFIQKGHKKNKFVIKSDYRNPFAWDFGKTRLFDRKHVRQVGKHYEFTRFYYKIMKALRFTKSEPVDWRSISLSEVHKHRYQNDCWMVIKGRVYDVTSYLKKHPGGAHLVMQGAGLDSTDMFVAVHPYVVFYELLPRLQIGTVPDFQEHPHTVWEPPAHSDIFRVLKEWAFRPKHPLAKFRPTTKFEQNEFYYVYTVTFPSSMKSVEADWTISIIGGFEVTVIKFLDPPNVWYGGFDLKTRVVDDSVYRWFSSNYNTLQLKIAKSFKAYVPKPIKDWRQDHNFFLSSYALKTMFKASVVERTSIADGVKLYGISVGVHQFIGCPIGCYVNLRILDEMRPYTPICLPDEFEKKFEEDSGEIQTLYFIIKEFKDGDFTAMLHYLPLKRLLKGVELYVSPPMGNFQPSFLINNMDVMWLFAGGTGISVMTRIIQEYIQKKGCLAKTSVFLLHFVQTREDMIWNDEWVDLDKKYKWFHYFYSLTRVYRYVVSRGMDGKGDEIEVIAKKHQEDISGVITGQGRERDKMLKKKDAPRVLEFAPENPREIYGYPAVDKLKFITKLFPEAGEEGSKHKAIVCGPFGFNQSVERMLKEYGKVRESDVYYFAG